MFTAENYYYDELTNLLRLKAYYTGKNTATKILKAATIENDLTTMEKIIADFHETKPIELINNRINTILETENYNLNLEDKNVQNELLSFNILGQYYAYNDTFKLSDVFDAKVTDEEIELSIKMLDAFENDDNIVTTICTTLNIPKHDDVIKNGYSMSYATNKFNKVAEEIIDDLYLTTINYNYIPDIDEFLETVKKANERIKSDKINGSDWYRTNEDDYYDGYNCKHKK